eukprot:360578-Chlamydomonas_euryale.AAC.2
MQFADEYRNPERYDVCMVPGNVPDNQFTDGARAICGGSSGIQVLHLGDIVGRKIVGHLIIWRGLNNVIYFTVDMECDSTTGDVVRA